MSDHIIKFTGKISWEGQSNGLPPEIFAYLVFTEYDRQMFDQAIENQSINFIRYQGMGVQKDQGQIIDLRQMPADRMFVPMRWIVNITADVINLVGELPQPDEEGTERLRDGSEPLKQ